jgi:hypothetical protein
MDRIEKAAERIKEYQKRIYTPHHEYCQINPNDFRHLDLMWYDQTRDLLVARGCRCLGDFENVSLKGTWNDFRTFLRTLVTSDGGTSIGLYHPKPKWWLRVLFRLMRIKLGKLIDCESELSDGTYIITTNAMEAANLQPPPGFDNEFFPHGTAPEIVYEAHVERLRDYLISHPEVEPTKARTQADVLDMQHRIQAAKAAYRQQVGYASVGELQNLGADPQTAAQIKEAMDRKP